MKLLTSLLIFVISNIALAGGSGGGVGPRPGMGVFRTAPGVELFGDRAGGGGWLTVSSLNTKNAELVKLLGREQQGKVVFKYKPAGDFKVEIHKLDISEFNETYLEAIKKSAKTMSWEEVKIEE